jgi:hypothetical protein
MRAVLGIDAAWTLTQPSGVAVVAESSDGWRLAGVGSSYQRFYCLADPARQAEPRPSGSEADAVQSISCASRLCGGAIDLIAVDMPLARTPITQTVSCFCDMYARARVMGFYIILRARRLNW